MSPDPSSAVPRHELRPGYSVPRIINGAWQLSRGHRVAAPDPQTTLAQLRQLVNAGLDTFDCGDIYLGVERLLGDLRRETPEIRIHTKLVPDRDDLARIDRAYVERIVHRSLRRLDVERLDMVQLSWWDYAVPGYVETAQWLDGLRRAGKIRLLGVTNFNLPCLREIVDAGVPVVTHQVQYSLLDRRAERGMSTFCQEKGIGLLAYGSVGGGFLADGYRGKSRPDEPPANRSLAKYLLMIDEFGGWDRFQELLACLHAIARRHQVSVANVAVRWALERPGVAAAIVGAAGAQHLDDNLRLFEFSLDETDTQALNAFGDAGPAGDVYDAERVKNSAHAAIMKYNLNRESTD